MAGLNRIIGANWHVTEPHWTDSASPFRQDFGVILAEAENALVAFSVYRRLRLDGVPTVYRCGTEVLPQHQRRGLYGAFTRAILEEMRRTHGAHADRIRYSWRTRNPIVWAANAKLCDKVVPSLLDDAPDPALQAACLELAAILYPDKPLEAPAMIMRGAYGHITHRPQLYHGMASLVAAAMERLIPNPADAVLSLGTVRL